MCNSTDGMCVLFNSCRLLNKLRCNASAILGDQMGLGKTIQTVVFASAAHALGLVEHTVLVVVPLSTVPNCCLLYTSPSPRDQRGSRMPSSA